MKPLSLPEFRSIHRDSVLMSDDMKRVARLLELRLEDPTALPNPAVDPFSREYIDEVRRIHTVLSERAGYDPSRDELINIDPVERARKPSIFASDSKYLGSFVESIGIMLKLLDVKPGQRIIEFGAGDGQVALYLARLGCDVTVIDIEPRYAETINLQASLHGVTIQTLTRDFRDISDLGKFDAALFFEAFHHALEHADLLAAIHDLLNDDGRVVLAGEPILEPGSFWLPTVPFPWGLRLDGLSLSAVLMSGWMELGFQEWYFVEAAMRAGFLVQRVPSPNNAKADAHILTKRPDTLLFSGPFLLPNDGSQEAGWFPPEPHGRWFGTSARLPFDRRTVGKSATLRLNNYVHDPKPLTIRCGEESHTYEIAPSETSVTFPIAGPCAILSTELTDGAVIGVGQMLGLYAIELTIG
jgi:2-polyprenyl-3-methyl-5-hydroxy-6-metoxy-1,4-benzoquinol methylase